MKGPGMSAESEMLKRVRQLDDEESQLRFRASRHLVSAADDEREADALAITRRQYEFALKELGADVPEKPKKKRIPVSTVEREPATL